MFQTELKSQKDLLSRYSKPRSSGLKEVSVKNSRSIDSFTKYDKAPTIQNHSTSLIDQDSRISPNQKNQLQHSTTIPSQFIQFCPKPNLRQNQNTLILDKDIDSRIILKIHSTEKQHHKSVQIKSKSIKIGSKAQKYRQNNKSEPKKVFDLQNLSSERQKEKAIYQSKDLRQQAPIELKKTQRKNSPNIFVCTKNASVSTEIGAKLKKFEQDLKKTKKPHAMKLQLSTGRNNYNIPQNKIKTTVSLKNHQMDPKIEPFVYNDIKISPSPEAYCNRISCSNSISPASRFHFSYGQPLKRQEISALQKTKKITSHFIQNFEMVSPRFHQEIQMKNDFSDAKQIEGLIPTSQMKFVLDRLCSNSKKTTQSVYVQQKQFQPPSIESIQFPESSSKPYSPQKQSQTQKKQVKIFTFKELQIQNIHAKQALSLRATDYVKNVQKEPDLEESALSERKNIVFKTNQKTNGQKAKIHSLNEGAKTIITKYDSSEKRSIIDESIIIFQCSKDLKQSFSRQAMDTYATKYRGSLGVEALIKQNDEDDMQTNEQNPNHLNQNTDLSGFENILFNSNSNNGGKLRKSYSIKEVEASINF